MVLRVFPAIVALGVDVGKDELGNTFGEAQFVSGEVCSYLLVLLYPTVSHLLKPLLLTDQVADVVKETGNNQLRIVRELFFGSSSRLQSVLDLADRLPDVILITFLSIKTN